MVAQHILLFFCWIVYAFLHSGLATSAVKDYFRTKMSLQPPQYRLVYNIVAIVTLAGLLYFEFSIDSIPVFRTTVASSIVALLFICTGGIVMTIMIGRYFRMHSGFWPTVAPQSKDMLILNGLHKYMRHPLYSGTLVFITGLFIWFPKWSHAIALMVITCYVAVGSHFEEKKLIEQFGDTYLKYRANVPMFLPGLRKKKA